MYYLAVPNPKGTQKTEMVAFKADGALLLALQQVPNRSEFIRTAVLAALNGSCPLCGGTGVLSLHQREHWERFAKDHLVEKCSDCHEARLVCRRGLKAAQKRKT